jgi:hypothetical protein
MYISAKKVPSLLFIFTTIIVLMGISYAIDRFYAKKSVKKSDNGENDSKEGFTIIGTIEKVNMPTKADGTSYTPTGYYRADATTGKYSATGSKMIKLPVGDLAIPQPYDVHADIPEGYYNTKINSIDYLVSIPYGYIAGPNKDSIVPSSKTATITNMGNASIQGGATGSGANSTTTSSVLGSGRYSADNYDVNYHTPAETLAEEEGNINKNMVVRDSSGNMVNLTLSASQPTPTFFVPGSYTFGSSTYVPSYEDSVYLSRTTGLSTLRQVKPTSSMLGGFCGQLSSDPTALEQKCNSLDNTVCASTDCCVLLGGSKCVAGNERGPKMTANYSDVTIRDKDYYYYKSKCYGRCA